MSDPAVYTEPVYLLEQPTTALLSEARPLHLSTAALLSLNYLLDELLHLAVNAALGSAPGMLALGPLAPLAPLEVLTTERFKAGLIRVVGPLLGKNAVLEAELAVREMLRLGAPSIRIDAALRKLSVAATASAPDTKLALATSAQADDIFRSLRAFIQIISGLGVACPSTGPGSVSTHLVAITPPPVAPAPSSPHLTFITALYAERCMTFIAEHVVRAVGRVTERESRVEAAGLKELEAALGEDQSIWTWFKSMRVRAYIEAEIAAADLRSSNTSGKGRVGAQGSAPRRATLAGAGPRVSSDSVNSGTGLSYGKKGKDAGLGVVDAGEDDFESLMSSGKTMKVTLTPDRLQTMEKRERASRLAGNALGKPMPTSASMPALSSTPSSPPTAAPGSAHKRLMMARNARKREPIDEDDAEEELSGAPHRKPAESLLDLLNSPPPWPENEEKFASPPASHSRKGSISRSLLGSPKLASIAMGKKASQSSVQSYSSESDFAEYQESPRTRQAALKAKDERADLAHERQINYDLVDFFANAPVPPKGAENPGRDDQSVTSTQSPTKKKSGGIRGFMSKVKSGSITNKNRDNDSISVLTTKSSNGSALGPGSPSQTRPGAWTDSPTIPAPKERDVTTAPTTVRDEPSIHISPPLAASSPALITPTSPLSSNDMENLASTAPTARARNGSGSSESSSRKAVPSLADEASRQVPPQAAESTDGLHQPIVRKMMSSRSVGSNDTQIPASDAPSFTTARDYSGESASSDMYPTQANGLKIAGAVAASGVVASVGLAASHELPASPDESAPDTPQSVYSPQLASGVASPASVYAKESDDGRLAAVRTTSGPAIAAKSLHRRRVSGFELNDSELPAPVPMPVAPVVPVESEPAQAPVPAPVDEEDFTAGSTLLALKLRMASSRTAEECIALLDVFIASQKSFDAPASSAETAAVAAVVPVVVEQTPEAVDEDSSHDASLAEFFLGDSPPSVSKDFPAVVAPKVPSSIPSNIPVAVGSSAGSRRVPPPSANGIAGESKRASKRFSIGAPIAA